MHAVLGNTTREPFPVTCHVAVFACGCFWGAERYFWKVAGVYSTQVGYSGGNTTDPTYGQISSETTGHCEAVKVVYDPDVCPYDVLLKTFWESHDPTQGNRQGEDVGSRYRSCIFTMNEVQQLEAEDSRRVYQDLLNSSLDNNYGPISTTIEPASTFYYAEEHHQQYLFKNPKGYCGVGGTGVSCSLGLMRKHRKYL